MVQKIMQENKQVIDCILCVPLPAYILIFYFCNIRVNNSKSYTLYNLNGSFHIHSKILSTTISLINSLSSNNLLYVAACR